MFTTLVGMAGLSSVRLPRRSDASFLWVAARPALSDGLRGRAAAHAQLKQERKSR